MAIQLLLLFFPCSFPLPFFNVCTNAVGAYTLLLVSRNVCKLNNWLAWKLMPIIVSINYKKICNYGILVSLLM